MGEGILPREGDKRSYRLSRKYQWYKTMKQGIAFWWIMIVSISPWILAWIFWRFGK
jgi:hypothetical protein